MKTAVEPEPHTIEAARHLSVEQSILAARPHVPAQPPPPIHPVHALQRSLGNRATRRILTGGILQPKLTVGAPDDAYEKEADAVAEQVMARTSPTAAGASGTDDDDRNHRGLARKATDRKSVRRDILRRIPMRTLQQTLGNRALARLLQETRITPVVPELSRKCACGGDAKEECAECSQKKLALQRSQISEDGAGDAPPIVEEVLAPPGQSLAESALTPTAAGGQFLGQKARANVSDSSMRMATKFAGTAPTFEDWGGGVLCKSPLFTVTGQVSVPSATANGDLTAGFMQVLVGCTGPKGRYWDANDKPYMTGFAPYAKLPVRDAEPNGVFYGPEAQKTVDSPSVTVSMSDQPQTSLPWATPDGKGKLQQIIGEHQFVTWLVVKSDSTGELVPLRYFAWSVGWFAAVDPSSMTPFDVGKIADSGEGTGPMAPIRSGPVANQSGLPTRWDPWT